MNRKQIFHVHTYRCGHAENIPEEEYIKKAISLKATDIYFTDHAPFPGDIFMGRMKLSELYQYIDNLTLLKNKYKKIISIHIGLEIEYFPDFIDYYKKLKNQVEFLILGQHMYKINEIYSFMLPEEQLKKEEALGLCLAMIEGIETGLFTVCAHPDRMFRRQTYWNNEMSMLSKKIINLAYKHQVILEKNISSMLTPNCYWPQFWNLVPEHVDTIIGIDAHKLSDLDLWNNYLEEKI